VLAKTRRRADAAAARLADAAAEKRAVVVALERRHDLTAARLAAEARVAEEAAEHVEAAAPPAAETLPIAVPATGDEPVAGGTQALVVDAVAYHLPGRTASGLPVGVGVIAVDPSVIPLGTRVFVPGYGPAVAADTGAAIKGNIIDLWMPSTAAARAWGRRTITITVYGS
jgi:3D (Asp-Asp-Asp) domain-containing protein